MISKPSPIYNFLFVCRLATAWIACAIAVPLGITGLMLMSDVGVIMMGMAAFSWFMGRSINSSLETECLKEKQNESTDDPPWAI